MGHTTETQKQNWIEES